MTAGRGERWAARALIGLMLSALACGDTEPEAPPRLLVEDFESRCDDLPCGWSRLSGDPGQATYVTTIHAGEHGLRLDGSGVSVRGPGGESRSASFTFSSLQVALSAVCDAGSGLTVRVAVTDARDAGATTGFDVLEGRVTPPSEWSSDLTLTVTSTGALADGGGLPAGGLLVVSGITITKDGPGECLIDHLVIDDLGLVSPDSPDDGCG